MTPRGESPSDRSQGRARFTGPWLPWMLLISGISVWNAPVTRGAPDPWLADQAGPVTVIEVADVTTGTGHLDLPRLLHAATAIFMPRLGAEPPGAGTGEILGLGSERLLVRVDGVPWHRSASLGRSGVSSRGEGGIDLAALPIAAIDRIEVRVGIGREHAGEGALGIVDIILRREPGSDAVLDVTRQRGGNGRADHGSVHHGFAADGGGSFDVTADVVDREGFRDLSTTERGSLLVRFDRPLGAGTAYGHGGFVRSRLADQEASHGGKTDDLGAVLGWRKAGPLWSVDVHGRHGGQRWRDGDGSADSNSTSRHHEQAIRLGLERRCGASHDDGPTASASAALTWRREEFVRRGDSRLDLAREVGSATVGADWRATSRLVLDATVAATAVRDRSQSSPRSTDEDHVAWRLGGRFGLGHGLTARGAFARGLRTPSLVQVGSAAESPLRPETGRSLTVGALWQIDPLWNVSLDAYQIEVDDRIAITGDPGSRDAPPSRPLSHAVHSRSRGILLHYVHRHPYPTWSWDAVVSAQVGATEIVSTTARSTDRRELQFLEGAPPRARATARFGFRFRRWRIGITILHSQYVETGSRAQANDPSAAPLHYHARIVADLVVAATLRPGLELVADVRNLLGARPSPQDPSETASGSSRDPVQMGTDGTVITASLVWRSRATRSGTPSGW